MDHNRMESIRNHVTDLVEIFLDNMEGNAFVGSDDDSFVTADITNEGMATLGKRFNEVPLLDRIAVYSLFLDELTLIGIPYNEDQFEQVPGSVH